jgi:hypothetical protein
MELEEIDALREMLPAGRTLFTYAKHQYGLQLLRYAAKKPTPVAALRQSPAAPLLQKPPVKAALSQCGNKISRAFLDAHIGCLPAAEHYALSLGVWAPPPGCRRAMQTSRAGANLVLQLNFSHQHNRAFERLLKPKDGWELNNGGHPVLHDRRAGRRYTLAWTRLDIDFDRGEALIEEIQTDWIREAKILYRIAAAGRNPRSRYWQSRFAGTNADIVEYYERHLAPHREHWDEAMLSTAIFFLREELGMSDIWMHTPRSGLFLKKMDGYGAPPVSLYTDLPRRFCFHETGTLPAFLARGKKTIRRLRRTPDVRPQKFML